MGLVLNMPLILILYHINFIQIKSEVIFVFEHFRHGARGPGYKLTEIFQEYTDEYGIKWKGNGELTPIGLRMAYILGVRNRHRYSNLLSSLFNPKEILVFSTTLSRTIMSAQAQLQGMFPPKTGIELTVKEREKALPPNNLTHKMKKEIEELGFDPVPDRVQIIPIHDFNEKEIFLLITSTKVCPFLGKVKQKLTENPEFQKIYQHFNQTYGPQLMKFFNKTNPDFLFNYTLIFSLSDVFISDYDNGRNLSSLERVGINLEQYYQSCLDAKSFYLFNSYSSEQLGPLAVSPSMRKIIEWMEKRIYRDIKGNDKQKYEEPKFVMYSGHDMTLAPFQLFMKVAFGITQLTYPHFSSNLFYEIHRKDNITDRPLTINDYHVEYSMNGQLLLNITFVLFRRIAEKHIWSEENIQSFCQVPIEGTFIIMIVAGLIFISFVFFLMFSFFCFKKQEKKERWSERGEEITSIGNDEVIESDNE